MTPWPVLPDDVRVWLKSVFAEANRKATERLVNVPNIRETSLDDGLVEALVPLSPPRLLPSGAIVELHVHNIGGLRRLGSWETADIAVLIHVHRGGKSLARKIGMLQSKRLYPRNNDVDSDDPVGFRYGLNALLHPEQNSAFYKVHTLYEFDRECIYGALKTDDDQVGAIRQMNAELGGAICYLFYNPADLPTKIHYPVSSLQTVHMPPLGCRVFTADDVDRALSAMASNQSPNFELIEKEGQSSNWRLEDWIDLLLLCKSGFQFEDEHDEKIGRLLVRRSGPIGAAIRVSIAMPDRS